MRKVLYIANVFGSCRYWSSEQKRHLGYMRYLPLEGWQVVTLVKACRCAAVQAESPWEVRVAVGDEPADEHLERVTSVLKRYNNALIKIECQANLYYRLWLGLTKLAGYSFASSEAEAELLHVVHPVGSPYSGHRPKRGLILLAKLAARGIPRSEMDRIDWTAKASRVGCWIGRKLGIDAVIGSSPPINNIEIAAKVSRACGLPWIADFRDAAVRNGCADGNRHCRLKGFLKSAHAVVHVTPQEAERDASLYCGPSYIIENGFLAEELAATDQIEAAASIANRSMCLRFVGTIYPGMRTLDTFLDGLVLLKAAGASGLNRLRFEYYGPSHQIMKQAVSERTLDHMCAISGSVGSDQALTLMCSSDALVLPTNCLGISGMPGAKIYEYLASMRPIIAAGGPDAYVEDLLHKTQTGYLCANADSVMLVLKKWMHEWLVLGSIKLKPKRQEVLKYERQNGVRMMAHHLNETQTCQ